MPEGPECTRTARQVDRAVRGKSLVNINFISGRYVKSLPTGFANFYIALEEKHLPVKGVFNKGKFSDIVRILRSSNFGNTEPINLGPPDCIR